MTALKAYTDIEQSKKLAEILPLESADMEYILEQWIDEKTHRHKEGYCEFPVVKVDDDCPLQPITLPCWSLAALLESIPQEIFDGEYIIKYTINIREGSNNRWVLTYDHYENINHSYHGLSSDADKLVDACYEMILKLRKLKLL